MASRSVRVRANYVDWPSVAGIVTVGAGLNAAVLRVLTLDLEARQKEDFRTMQNEFRCLEAQQKEDSRTLQHEFRSLRTEFRRLEDTMADTFNSSMSRLEANFLQNVKLHSKAETLKVQTDVTQDIFQVRKDLQDRLSQQQLQIDTLRKSMDSLHDPLVQKKGAT